MEPLAKARAGGHKSGPAEVQCEASALKGHRLDCVAISEQFRRKLAL